MHLAPLRRRPFPSSSASARLLMLTALLLQAGGCALREPGPSPMVCPSTPGGCAKEDAPWYRQDVTAMIPPPPVDPAPPPAPAATDPAGGVDTSAGDPSATPAVAEVPPEPVVSSFAMPEDRIGVTDTPSTAHDSPPAAPTAAPGTSAAPRGTPLPAASTVSVFRLAADRLFERDGVTLQPTGRRALDALADQLHGTPYTRIRVIGHTDRSGRATTNLKLSRQRARMVRDHLAGRGIPADVLDHEGRGSRDAAVDPGRCGRNKDARTRCLAPDRRVEIVVTRRHTP
jgi:outer membrane protein OmpA-like peptidoglycan-associated protein